ncbi:MAG: bifunctional nuclease family protein [Candidatus Hydrothermarchaeales archaeon]
MKKYLLLFVALVGIGLGALAFSHVYLKPTPLSRNIPSGYVEVEITDVEISHTGGVMYLREKDSDSVLPIFIGEGQAQIIIMLMNNVSPDRPLMHDLLEEVLNKVGIKLSYISVDRLDKGVFYATLVLENGRTLDIDARPSDSVILALSYGTPIYVHEALMRQEERFQHPSDDVLESLTI